MTLDPRLRQLVDAVLDVARDYDLPTVLQRIVDAAVVLVDARYGALGVIGEGQPRFLSQFIHTGIDAETAEAIGPLPQGRGILGLLVDQPRPLRLTRLSDHPAAHGLPPHHPPMESFLGVPVRVGDRVYGNLYLTEKRGGAEFSADDQELLLALAAVAGTAIAHAQLYDDLRRRERWRSAVLRVTTQLLTGADGDRVLQTVAASARDVVDADLASVAVPRPGGWLHVVAADGHRAGEVRDAVFALDGSLTGRTIATGEPMRLDDAAATPLQQPVVAAGGFGPMIIVPLTGHEGTFGSLMVANVSGGPTFTDDALQMLVLFAGQASVAVGQGRTQEELRRLTVFADRERIGRDLHDTVIQRLFATGLSLQGTARRAEDDSELVARISAAIEELDDTIRRIRSTIFALQSDPDTATGLRADIFRIVEELTPALGFRPGVRFDGPVDTVVDAPLAEQVLAVLRESLTNVARHARASTVDVRISVTATEVGLVVADDGVGVDRHGDGHPTGLGIGNMQRRAQLLGGDLTVAAAQPTGTVVDWRVPRR